MKMKFFVVLMVVPFVATSCVKEGHVACHFKIFNATESDVIVKFSSWGVFFVTHDGMWQSGHKFHDTETITPRNSLIMSVEVEDDNYYNIPPSVTPAWEYITEISCNGVVVPKEYYVDQKNWDVGVVSQLNGKFIEVRLLITPELLAQFAEGTQE